MIGGWLFDVIASQALWIAVSRIAMPLTFGTLGGLLCERAGVLNLPIEGIMVAGAFSGWFAVYCGMDLRTGLLVAMQVGALFGLLHAVLTVLLGLSQHVTGLGITMLASTLTFFAYRVLFRFETPPAITLSRRCGSSRKFHTSAKFWRRSPHRCCSRLWPCW